MAHTSPEDYSAEIRHLSSLIIEEILNSIISSTSSPSSSTKPVVCDPDYSYIDQSIPGCDEDSVTNTDRMVNGVKRLPGAKRVTFCEDVTVVCYEQTSAGEDENRETEFLIMEVDQKKDTVIEKKDEDVGSERDDIEDFKEKNTYADENILKRKCIGNVLEDGFMIPTKVTRLEVDSLFGHQNENGAEAHGSHFHSDKNKAKVEANQEKVEANQLVSYPSEVDSTVQGNPIADSLCPDDDDTVLNGTLPSELSSSNDDIIDDCRSVLQSLVDTTLHQTVQNTKSDGNLDGTSDTSEQPSIKKIKLAPPSDLQTAKNSFSNSLVPGLLSKEEIKSSNNTPRLVDTSTADVKQVPLAVSTNIKACSIEATVLCDNLSLDLSSEKESENGNRVLEGACDSTGVSTSTADVKADEDVDSTIVTEPAEVSSPLLKTSNVRENHNLTSNDDLLGEVCPYTSTPDVELVEDIPNITTKDESNAYSSILVQDLYLDDSVECSEQLEVIKLEFHCNKEDGRGNSLPSSADVKVVKPEDVYVDAIEPSLREDIMPSPGSSGDDFICTFQKASQVLASSQDEITCRHNSRKFDDLSLVDLDFMTNEDLQVPPFVSVRQETEETMHDVVLGDWKAFPDKDDSMLKVPEIPEQGHPDLSQESPSNLQYDASKTKESTVEHSEHQFLQIFGLSPKRKMNKCEEQMKSCDSYHSAAIPTCKMDSEFKDIEATEENDPCIPLLHPMSGYLGRSLIENSRLNSSSNVEIAAELNRAELLYRNLECSQIEGFKMESSSSVEIAAELSRDEVKVNNDQTVPSLQTPVTDNPCIDQLLELEESIFTEQDAKLQDGPMKQSIPVIEEAPYIEDEEDKPIPDHLQTLGQPAAGVFLWNHSLADPSLTPSLTKDQSNLQHAAENLNQTPPITPVRPLPVCQRKRRVGLSRRQLVYPLHAGTFSRK